MSTPGPPAPKAFTGPGGGGGGLATPETPWAFMGPQGGATTARHQPPRPPTQSTTADGFHWPWREGWWEGLPEAPVSFHGPGRLSSGRPTLLPKATDTMSLHPGTTPHRSGSPTSKATRKAARVASSQPTAQDPPPSCPLPHPHASKGKAREGRWEKEALGEQPTKKRKERREQTLKHRKAAQPGRV